MIKSKNSKKALSILLALIMVFAFSTNAFAAENDTVTLTLDVEGQSPVTYTVVINDGDTVYDVVDSAVGERAEWSHADPENPAAWILMSLDGFESEPYEAPDFEWEYYAPAYLGSDEWLDLADAKLRAKYADSDGLGLWIGDGTGFSNDGPYMAYISHDWTYTVNGETPGYPIDDPELDNFWQYYMNEAPVYAGDDIVLDYGIKVEVFSY